MLSTSNSQKKFLTNINFCVKHNISVLLFPEVIFYTVHNWHPFLSDESIIYQVMFHLQLRVNPESGQNKQLCILWDPSQCRAQLIRQRSQRRTDAPINHGIRRGPLVGFQVMSRDTRPISFCQLLCLAFLSRETIVFVNWFLFDLSNQNEMQKTFFETKMGIGSQKICLK